MLTLALSKGRILDDTADLLAACGIHLDPKAADSRQLILPTDDPGLRLLIVRASDVPTYVQHGAADLGIAGRDVMLEHGGEGVFQPVDLGIGRCRLCVAVPEGFDYAQAAVRGRRLRVATKYVRTASQHFARKGVHVDLIKLYGSMELAPLVGLADAIVDVVSTGNTLRANHLVEVEDIMPISARLIVNQAALKMRQSRLAPLIAQLEQAARVNFPSDPAVTAADGGTAGTSGMAGTAAVTAAGTTVTAVVTTASAASGAGCTDPQGAAGAVSADAGPVAQAVAATTGAGR